MHPSSSLPPAVGYAGRLCDFESERFFIPLRGSLAK